MILIIVMPFALVYTKEAGPEIFVQSHTLIFPSGSLELLPSSKILSVGKVISWSGPAIAMGGLLPSPQPSQEDSFLRGGKIKFQSVLHKSKF